MILDNVLLILCMNIAALEARHKLSINRIIDLIKRRYGDYSSILGVPRYPEDLPEAEPILPGHTLIRPSLTMLKSAVKFPRKDLDTAVYGNLNNLGITYGKTRQRVLYTDFRRANKVLDFAILQALRNIMKNNGNKRDTSVVVIEVTPNSYIRNQDLPNQNTDRDKLDIENNGSELLDNSSSEEEDINARRSQRADQHDHRHKFRNRNVLYRSDNETSTEVSSSSDDSDSSDKDRNPGNPFTIHRGKYLQNYMWNHFMDGDHLNINPHGPSFASMDPSGAELYFGRKWWYFNQDDYKPLN